MRELLEKVIAQCEQSGGLSGKGRTLYHQAKTLLKNGASDDHIVDLLWELVDRATPRRCTAECEALLREVIEKLPTQRSLT